MLFAKHAQPQEGLELYLPPPNKANLAGPSQSANMSLLRLSRGTRFAPSSLCYNFLVFISLRRFREYFFLGISWFGNAKRMFQHVARAASVTTEVQWTMVVDFDMMQRAFSDKIKIEKARAHFRKLVEP